MYKQALYNCAQMGIDPCEDRLRDRIPKRFPKLSLAGVTPGTLTNMLYSVATQPSGHHSSAEADTTVLETKTAHKLCTRVTRMLNSSEAEDQCTEDDVASSLRSLTALKHKPNSGSAVAFCDWYSQLLRQLQDESPPCGSLRLGIILAACVDLRLKLPASVHHQPDSTHPWGQQTPFKPCKSCCLYHRCMGFCCIRHRGLPDFRGNTASSRRGCLALVTHRSLKAVSGFGLVATRVCGTPHSWEMGCTA